ncbi:iron ABC transporter permease [Devosia soli]|uniref:Iron ABC transporter permease n=2 Tax=Devosia soli TaxID=361041 RepID=A0A0F5L855_9HYPH|nr:iron ABC transporter permease [Devosia soli]
MPARTLRLRRTLGLAGLSVLLIILVLASIGVGARPIGPDAVWRALTLPDGGRDAIIVWQLRLPRTLLGILVGIGLGLSGALMQALTRNPLAAPGLLGINAGAAFLVVMAIAFFGITDFSAYVWFAMAGCAGTAALVYRLSGQFGSSVQQVRLILAGAAISACLGAATGIITLYNAQTFDSYRFWVVGSLQNRTPEVAFQVLPIIAIGAVLAVALGGRLNAMALGDDMGRALGLRIGQVRALSMIAMTLLCGGSTAAAGPVGFIGLMVPHAVRLIVGPDWRWVLPYSVLAGPVIVLGSDIVGRIIAPPGELEVGIVTAFLGAPVLLLLVLRADRPGRA